MSFLDNISQGKKEPNEIQRVEMNIVQTEAVINEKFLLLGQAYFADNKDNLSIDQKYREQIDAILKLDENRRGFYAHKLRLEGNMMCVNCGKIIPYGSVYCSFCGKTASEKQDDEETENQDGAIGQCPKCGAPISGADAKFCTACGSPIM